MAKQNDDLELIPTEQVAERMQSVVLSVTGVEGLKGFKKAFVMAEGIQQLKAILTPQYMAPIMQLQGSRLGFRTDRDIIDGKPGPGYPMEVVKNCVIEAVLNGYEVTGNQFNIIAGNMYATKEGTGSKLNKFVGLKQQIVCGLPRMSNDGSSAAVDVSIKWTINGETKTEIVPIPIRVNKGMGIDAIIGKATRKARAWLLSHITGTEVPEGDVDDQTRTATDVTKKKDSKDSDEEVESQRWLAMIKEQKTVEELEFFGQQIPEELREAYNKRMDELKAAKK